MIKNSNLREYLTNLHGNENFQALMEDLVREAPHPRPYVPSNDSPDQTTRWVYESGLEEGYRLALSHLGVNNV